MRNEFEEERPEREIATWPVDDLKPHPLQANYFNDLSDVAIQHLAEDIDRNELGEPLEILPDGTIVSGHQRLRAVQELGWDEVDVWIRRDLAAQGESAIERRLIEANLNRRHSSPLDLARAYKRLKELTPRSGRRNGHGDLRDEIGARLGLSGRQLDRLAALLDLPREIQQAVDNKKLTAKAAAELAKLPKEAHDAVVETIRKGGNVKMAVAKQSHRYATPTPNREPTETELWKYLQACLKYGRWLLGYREQVLEVVNRNQIPEMRKLGKFTLDLCDAVEEASGNGKPTTNGKPRAKSTAKSNRKRH